MGLEDELKWIFYHRQTHSVWYWPVIIWKRKTWTEGRMLKTPHKVTQAGKCLKVLRLARDVKICLYASPLIGGWAVETKWVELHGAQVGHGISAIQGCFLAKSATPSVPFISFCHTWVDIFSLHPEATLVLRDLINDRKHCHVEMYHPLRTTLSDLWF